MLQYLDAAAGRSCTMSIYKPHCVHTSRWRNFACGSVVMLLLCDYSFAAAGLRHLLPQELFSCTFFMMFTLILDPCCIFICSVLSGTEETLAFQNMYAIGWFLRPIQLIVTFLLHYTQLFHLCLWIIPFWVLTCFWTTFTICGADKAHTDDTFCILPCSPTLCSEAWGEEASPGNQIRAPVLIHKTLQCRSG